MDLLERDGALTALEDAYADAAAGRGRVALVYGDAGIGKSSLGRAFLERVEDRARVLVGACDDLLTARPLGPFRDLAPHLGPVLREALAAGATGARIFELLAEDLTGAGRTSVLLVEDVHWADEASLDVLTLLGRRIERLPVLLVLTYREQELTPQHPLGRVVGTLPPDATRRIGLEPLSTEAVQALTPLGEDAMRLHSETGGNPFFVTELVAAHREGIPATVTYSVLARIAGLPEETRALLELLAVVPARAETWLLDACMPRWQAAAAPAEARGMLLVEPGTLRFRHELARRAVEAALPALRRRELNASVLAALRAREAEPARLAHHAEHAGDLDALVAFGAEAARRAAALNAHREAAAHYRAVLQHAGRIEPAARAGLWQGYSRECFTNNAREEAVTGAREALELRRALDDPEALADALLWSARVAWWVGEGRTGRNLTDEAITLLETLEPGPELAKAYAYRAQLAMFHGRSDQVEIWAGKAIELAGSLGDGAVKGQALSNLGVDRYVHGRDDGAVADEGLALLLANGVHDEAGRTYMNLGYVAATRRDYPRALRLLTEGAAFATQHELLSYLEYMQATESMVRFEQGEWDAARATAAALTARDDLPITVFPAMYVLARLHVRRGEPDAAELVERLWTWAEQTGEMQRLGPAAYTMAEHAWLHDRLDDALPRVARVLEPAARSDVPRMAGESAKWLHRAGVLDEVPPAVEGPTAMQLAGRWKEAAEEWRRLGCPYDEADALASADDPDALMEALRILDRLEAEPLAARVRAKLRALGVRAVPRGPQPATRSNVAGLTARQADVLRLLAQGMTNAEIAAELVLSTRTVDHHVSAVLAKLEVETRAQAGRRAAELGLA